MTASSIPCVGNEVYAPTAPCGMDGKIREALNVKCAVFVRDKERLLSLTPQDENPNLRLGRIEWIMNEGLYLHGLGIVPLQQLDLSRRAPSAGASESAPTATTR
jgi:hypothetical protein